MSKGRRDGESAGGPRGKSAHGQMSAKRPPRVLTERVATTLLIALIALAIVAFVVLRSLVLIGPTEVGLVTKRFSIRRLSDDDIIAFNGEAGYQADLLMPGLRFKLWPVFIVSKHPWVQVPAGEIGVVIAQVGEALPVGAKSAIYNEVLGNFSDVRNFIANGGQKGVQRPVLTPGSLLPLHPAAFIVGLVSVFVAIWLTAKIFRIGVLMYGKPPNLRTLIRWVRMA